MSEFKSHVETKMGSEKGFSIVFTIVFLIIGFYPLLNSENIRLWSLFVALILLVIGSFSPKILSVPNKLWFKLGIFLGAIIAPIVMALVYVVSVVPIGLLVRLMGKDLLQQKLDKSIKSYWIEREQPVGSMRDQF